MFFCYFFPLVIRCIVVAENESHHLPIFFIYQFVTAFLPKRIVIWPKVPSLSRSFFSPVVVGEKR